MKYTILLFCSLFLFGCKSEPTTKVVEAEAVNLETVEPKKNKKTAEEKRVVPEGLSAQTVEQVKSETTQREGLVASIEKELATTCLPKGSQNEVNVVIVVEADGKLSFSEVYKAPSDAIKKCIKDKLDSGDFEFGEITEAGSSKHKTGKTMHDLKLVPQG